MKGVVLSGGHGTRLRPMTYTMAKQLLPVANKPILFYVIESLKEAGIEDIGIVVGSTKDEVKAAVGDGSRWRVRITYIEQDQPRGLAHAVQIASPFIGAERFCMFLGDNLIKHGVRNFVEQFRDADFNSQILLSRVDHPEHFGVATIEGDKVTRLVEKPQQPASNLALVGVYFFDQHIKEAVNEIKPSPRGELEITDAIQYLIDRGYRVRPCIIDGWWKDTGRTEDLLEANRLKTEEIDRCIVGSVDESSLIDGRVRIGSGTRVINSVVRGPSIIGENCWIENSYVGPFTSLGDGVRIVASEIEYSIVMNSSTIEYVSSRIEASLIGRNVTVAQPSGRPRSFRLVLGDNSQVGVF